MNSIAVLHQDHRVRVAKEKRERMRAHLLQSVFEVCSAQTNRDAAIVNEVVRHAGVSRGTFYKYFQSLDEAITALGVQLADEMTAGIYSVYGVLEAPVQRAATGFQMFLIRAAIDPAWGSFIAHMGLLRSDGLLAHSVRTDVRQGMENGDFTTPSLDVATDLLMGAKTEAIRRIISGEGGISYIHMMTAIALQSLGLSPSKAVKIVQKAYRRLCLESPGKIEWWRPLE